MIVGLGGGLGLSFEVIWQTASRAQAHIGYDRILHKEMRNAFVEVTKMSGGNIKHTQDYYDCLTSAPAGQI